MAWCENSLNQQFINKATSVFFFKTLPKTKTYNTLKYLNTHKRTEIVAPGKLSLIFSYFKVLFRLN